MTALFDISYRTSSIVASVIFYRGFHTLLWKVQLKIVNRVLLLNITIQLYKQEIWSCNSGHTLIFASQYQLLD